MKRGFLNSKKAKAAPLYPSEPPPVPVITTERPAEKIDVSRDMYKLPFQKIEPKDALPEDYKSSLKIDILAGANPADRLSLITIPLKPDSNGFSQCLIDDKAKQKIFGTPGHPKPIPKISKIKYVIKSIPMKGLGLFATHDIKFGDLIFSERPLLVTPSVGLYSGGQLPKGYTLQQVQRVWIYEYEKVLEKLVGMMSDEDQTAYKDLMNDHKHDGSGPLFGIQRTNQYGVSRLGNDPGGGQYGASCKIGSRINHSCMPNVKSTFTIASFSMEFTAIKDIKAGEEIVYSYCSLDKSAAERQKELAPYGFACDCPACVNATPETDKLRMEYAKTLSNMIAAADSPNLPDDALAPVLRFKNELDKEGLNIDLRYAGIFIALHKIASRQRKFKEADEYWRGLQRFVNLPDLNKPEEVYTV